MDKPQASNPGLIRLNYVSVFLRYHPFEKYFILFLFLIGLPPVVMFISITGEVKAGLYLGFPYFIFVAGGVFFRWKWLKGHFYEGDINPGVVVSLNPMLIAVSADLTFFSSREWPVIKIVRYDLPAIGGKIPKVGTRVATVGLYSGDTSSDRLNDITPIPVECATDDVEAQVGCLQRISVREWNRLKRDLARVPKPYRKGMYKMWQLRKR